MKTFPVFFGVLLVAGSLFAQNYSIAKQQARNAVAREEQNQQAINGSAPVAPAMPPPAAPQPNPALEATLQNIASLRADFDRFDSNPTNKQPLLRDLTAAAHGTKASPTSVSVLADNLSAALAGNSKLRSQHQKLAQNIHALFNSSHLSPAQQQAVLDSVQKILLDAGLSPDDTTRLIGNLKKIAAETK